LNEKEAIDLLIKSGCPSNVIYHCKAVAAYAKKIATDIKNAPKKKERLSILIWMPFS